MLARLYQDLEYEKIIEVLQGRCHSAAGKALAGELSPLSGIPLITRRMALICEIKEVIGLSIDFGFENLLPLESVLSENSTAVFGWEEFHIIYLNALLANQISSNLELVQRFPELAALVRSVKPQAQICGRYEQIFDCEGEVKETASPELLRIIRKKGRCREQIIRSLQKKLQDSAFVNIVQDKFVTQRDGRYVIPVKESAASQLRGIVMGHSGSRATVFMEPEDVVGLNNDLQLIQQEEKREIFRIFQEFTFLIKSVKDELESNYRVLAQLDLWFACGRLAQLLKCNPVQIVDEPLLSFRKSRHPLLLLKEIETAGSSSVEESFRKVIPFDLDLGGEVELIVLSGPNTGGKTVLLKAAGLLSLMALTGLPIPADEETVIGSFTQIAADVGDEQSIEQALSTFSSHLTKIKSVLENCGERTLILFDEIGAATDPQQGSALAQAMLEYLLRKRVKGIVTTHYTALKVFAENSQYCRNASMEFDLKSLHPTYRFHLGLPGDSFAIEVAALLGIPAELIERAKTLTGTQNLEFTRLINRLQEEKKKLDQEKLEFHVLNRSLDSVIKKAADKIVRFDSEISEKRREFLKQQQQEIISLQKQLNSELEEIKKLDREERKKAGKQTLTKLLNRQDNINAALEKLGKNLPKPLLHPKIGDFVWLSDFETEARIENIEGDDVYVDMNGIRFKTRLDRISQAEAKEDAKPAATRVKANLSAQFELKLLGLTFDEAQPLIDEFIDQAMVSGLHKLRIIHGKGTGALRTKVRNYLKTKKQIISVDTPMQEVGGSGVTIVSI